MAFVNISATSVKELAEAGTHEGRRKDEDKEAPSPTKESAEVKAKSYKRSFDCGSDWWKSTVIYEVYVRSFYDSNDDGIGDLKGIEEKLDYFEYLGVETLWITPMFPSPMVDWGYDISDFTGIDPIFGTMEDFKKLVRSMKDKGMKLIIDLVANHTSSEHEWFKMSVLKQEPYTDYYVWRSPKGFDSNGQPIPPNNWTSVFRGSAWTYNESREQFYLHQFAKEQPDLNFRNPLVLQEMVNIMNFWLENNVDGFRIDAAPHILEDEEFRDNPPAKLTKEGGGTEGDTITTADLTEEDYCFWDHIHTCNCKGVLDILATFRSVCDEWSKKDGHERVLVTEGYLPLLELMEYYGTPTSPIAHFSFNFELLGLNKDCTALDAFNCIARWMDALPAGCWPNWQTGNHDQPRIASKLGKDLIDIMNMLLLLLPGTALTYYGEEIGMENTEISYEDTKDPAGRNAGPKRYHLFSRDPERSVMQWSSQSRTAGFSDSAAPWLPVNPNFLEVNVKAQTAAERSHLKTYKTLITLRDSEAWRKGDLDLRVLSQNSILAFSRIDDSSKEGLLVLANFSHEAAQVDISQFEYLNNSKSKDPSTSMTVVAISDTLDTYTEGSVISAKEIQMSKRSGLVLKFISTAE